MFRCRMPQIQAGEGVLSDIGKIAVKYGNRAMLCVDPFLDKNGVGEKIIARLSANNIDAVKFSEIEPNPSCFSADRAALMAQEFNADLIIAAGGGSALDFGKAVSITAVNPGACWDYTERSDHQIKRPGITLPVIAIPSTSGTGSEATPFAVLNNPSIHEKSTIVSDCIYAAEALLDPELTYTMPKRLTASTGFDAFAHCLESYISLAANPFTRMTAMEGMKIIVRNLAASVNNSSGIDNRGNMAWGSFLGGSAISCIGVTLPHSLGQPVGGYCNAPHGECVAACMVEVLKLGCDSNPQIFSDIAFILDDSLEGLSVQQRADACPQLVEQFLGTIGLKVRFSDFGLTAADIDKVTRIALTGYYFDIRQHPRRVTEQDIRELYKRCL